MFKRTYSAIRAPDRLTYLWLAIAAVSYAFTGGPWVIPLAAWLAPLFLLRVVRQHSPLGGLLLAWLARFVVGAIVLHGIILIAGAGFYVIVLLLALLTSLPYLADRLMTPHVHGFAATLIFPVAFTALEFLASFSPNGTMYSLAYSQYGNLPLMQLVSVTGIWGITFLITWFASVANWAWERQFDWPRLRRGASLYAGVLVVVLVGGGARLALFPPSGGTVRVAGLSASRAAVASFNQQLPQSTITLLESGKATQAQRAQARTAFATLDDDLLARTQQEAAGGAKIVVWPEASPVGANILQEDEQALIQRASSLAQQDGIYLDMGVGVFLSGAGRGPYLKDEAVLVDPSGQSWIYEKTHLVPFGEQGLIVPGNGKLPLVSTPYGKLAVAICFDLDFPSAMRQAGQGGADVMLASADDWQAIDPMHTQHAVFRAIEGGYSLVRESSKGLSITVDYEGNVLASSDYFAGDHQVMVAYAPIHGVRTIYAAIGDVFAWLCLLGLFAFIGVAVVRARGARSTPQAVPGREQQPVGSAAGGVR